MLKQNCGQNSQAGKTQFQYYYYFPEEDKTSPIVMTTSFMQIEMFSQMRDSLRGDFLKQDIKYDSTQIWTK